MPWTCVGYWWLSCYFRAAVRMSLVLCDSVPFCVMKTHGPWLTYSILFPERLDSLSYFVFQPYWDRKLSLYMCDPQHRHSRHCVLLLIRNLFLYKVYGWRGSWSVDHSNRWRLAGCCHSPAVFTRVPRDLGRLTHVKIGLDAQWKRGWVMWPGLGPVLIWRRQKPWDMRWGSCGLVGRSQAFKRNPFAPTSGGDTFPLKCRQAPTRSHDVTTQNITIGSLCPSLY
jgi:hypothetical protein